MLIADPPPPVAMHAFFATISNTGVGSAPSATTAATAAAGAGPNVYARAVAKEESLLSTEDHSSAGGEGACVVSPVNGVTAGPDNSFSVGAAVTGEGDSAAAAAATGGGGGRIKTSPVSIFSPLFKRLLLTLYILMCPAQMAPQQLRRVSRFMRNRLSTDLSACKVT